MMVGNHHSLKYGGQYEHLAGPIIFLVGTLLALWEPTVSLVIFVLVPLGYLFEGPVDQIDEGYLHT